MWDKERGTHVFSKLPPRPGSLLGLLPFSGYTIILQPAHSGILCMAEFQMNVILFSCFAYLSFIIFLIFLTFYLFLRETECEWGRGRERRSHRIWSRLQAPSCQHRARCGARTHEPWDRDLSWSRTLNRRSHPGAPIFYNFTIKSISAKGSMMTNSVEYGTDQPGFKFLATWSNYLT